VRVLVETARSKGTQVIAEGIETEPVAELCWELGCHLGQGYLFGRPAPVLEVTRSV
jgi:EAL domain-containing protein (putative c-di-GMP-specific phosphodiesterase class I)